MLDSHKSSTTKRGFSIGIEEVIKAIRIEDPAAIVMVSIATTLVTNAIAEDLEPSVRGKRVALLLIGYSPDLITTFQLGDGFATPHYFFLAGGHNFHGRETGELDLPGILAKVNEIRTTADAIAVSRLHSPMNPEHDNRSYKAISSICDLPLVLGHQLSDKLELAPVSPLNEQQLAQDLGMGLVPVREALKLLAYESLAVITPRHGLSVADVDVPDLQQLGEMRLTLESLSARLAAQRATSGDLVVLEALSQAQASTPAKESRRLFDVDHKFHQANGQAARDKYLAVSLERLLGPSQRLWYKLVVEPPTSMPHLRFLPSAVEKHLDLVEDIKAGDADRAGKIMGSHVQEFYDQVRETLVASG